MLHLTTGDGSAAPGSFTLKNIDFSMVGANPEAYLLPEGPYLGEVTDVSINVEKNRAELLFDVADGEYKSFFRRHPSAPDYLHTLYLSASENRLIYLKADLAAFNGYNPGFSSFASWNRDLREFIGKRFGFTAHRAEVKADRGVRIMPRYEVVSAEAFADGSYVIPGNVHADGTRDPDKPGFPIALGGSSEEPAGAFDDLLGDVDA